MNSGPLSAFTSCLFLWLAAFVYWFRLGTHLFLEMNNIEEMREEVGRYIPKLLRLQVPARDWRNWGDWVGGGIDEPRHDFHDCIKCGYRWYGIREMGDT